MCLSQFNIINWLIYQSFIWICSNSCYFYVAYITFVVSSEAKEQVLANLANFAYDPKNMEYLRELQVADLFLDMLTEENENFVEFGMGEYDSFYIVTVLSPDLKLSSYHC